MKETIFFRKAKQNFDISKVEILGKYKASKFQFWLNAKKKILHEGEIKYLTVFVKSF